MESEHISDRDQEREREERKEKKKFQIPNFKAPLAALWLLSDTSREQTNVHT